MWFIIQIFLVSLLVWSVCLRRESRPEAADGGGQKVEV